MFSVTPIPTFSDNYCWMIQHQDEVWLVDPGHGPAILSYLKQHKITPNAILITHNHWDHVGANLDLARYYSLRIYGPDQCPIPGITHPVKPGSLIESPSGPVEVLPTPGHRHEHISFYWPEHKALFCGDTLFSAGCGRILGGTIEQLFNSLQRIKKLPLDCQIYCAHEYTLANLKFAHAVEPGNSSIQKYLKDCQSLRANNTPTLPTLLETELAVNPFLRTHEAEVKLHAERAANKKLESELDVFTALRQWKDNFR